MYRYIDNDVSSNIGIDSEGCHKNIRNLREREKGSQGRSLVSIRKTMISNVKDFKI